MTTPKAHVALSRFPDLTKSAQMTVPKGQNDRTKSGGPYQKRNENAMTVPNVRGSLVIGNFFDFCLSITTRFDNRHIRSCLASRRSVAGRGPMAQGKSPRNPLAFASVSYPGRCLASQPIHLGSEVEEWAWFQQGRILNIHTLPAW